MPNTGGLRRAGARCLAAGLLALAVLGVLPSGALADVSGTEGPGIGDQNNTVQLGSVTYNPDHGTIYWGDGLSDSCNGTGNPPPLSPPFPPCYFSQQGEFGGTISGYHAYGEQGTYPYTIYWYDFQNAYIGSTTGNADIADAPLSGTAQAVTALVGLPFSGTVGHFTDADTSAPPATDYTATIDWGDGTPLDKNATIRASGNGFDVRGTHTYTAANTYQMTVKVADEAGATSSSTVTIKSTMTASSSGVLSLSPLEGEAFSGIVAQFCSPPGSPTGASIDWGDGGAADTNTTLTPVNTASCPNGYQVSGSHTYAEEAANPLTLTVTLQGSGAAPASGTATVGDAPLSATMDSGTLSGSSLTLPGSVIAHVKDGNAGAPSCGGGSPCDLTATISWGDGASGPGSVTPDPSGGFEVTAGPHTYPGPGPYTITVSVSDKGGSTTQTSGTYTVAPPPSLGSGCKSPVPAIGATQGLYGAPQPSNTQPNWGISPDDRVLRFGNLVLCAVDFPWTYEGGSASLQMIGLQLGGLLHLARDSRRAHGAALPVAGGTFQTHGRVIVNGLELEPFNQSPAPMTVDTAAGSIAGPLYQVFHAQTAFDDYPQQEGELGTVDLSSDPWILQGSSLGYLPQGYNADGFQLSGPVHIRIDGLGTSASDATALLPDVFSLQAYSGGPPTSSVTFNDAYPGTLAPGAARDRVIRRVGLARAADVRAHAANDNCLYPAPTAPIHLEAPDLYLGGIEMHCAYIEYDPSTGDAAGGGGFGIGPVYVTGFLKLNHNAFAGAGGGVDGLNAPIFPGLTLDSIHFAVFLDPTRFQASAGLGIGGGLATLNGGAFAAFATNDHPYTYNQDFSFTGQDAIPGVDSLLYNHPFTSFVIGAGGSFSVLSLPLHVDGYGLYAYPDYIEFGGHMGLNVLDGAISVDAHLSGQFWISDRSFDIEGGANVCVVVLGCNGVSGVISSSGVIGCWDQGVIFGTISIGGGYHYGDSWPSIYFHGCTDNFGSYRVSAAADIASDGARTFIISKGMPNAMFRIVGTGGSPAFTVTGPHGETATAGADDSVSGNPQIVIMRSSRFDTTWVGIAHPGAGRWTFAPLAGSAPIAQTFFSPGLPPAAVHGRVLGRGRHRILRFTIRPRPNQSVRFVETGPGVSSVLATTSARRGAIRFSPAIGPAGRRQIIALVTLGGMPARRLVVASYVAPGPPAAGKPPRLRLRRSRGSLLISWGAGANATAYQVVVRASDGRRLLFHRSRGARSVSVGAFAASGASVQVRGVGPDGNTGTAATAVLRPVGRPGRIRGLTIHRNGSRVRIAWRSSAHALDYRVSLILSGQRPLLLRVAHDVLTFHVKSTHLSITVVVQAEGYQDSLGAKASARLKPAPSHHGHHKR